MTLADGSHVMFSATGDVQTAGTELVDLAMVHGLSVSTLSQNGNIIA